MLVIFVPDSAYIPPEKPAAAGWKITCHTIAGGTFMRMITLTKKKVKRLTAIGLLAAATAAAGVGAILTSVGTQATERQLPVYCVERGDNKISLTFNVA